MEGSHGALVERGAETGLLNSLLLGSKFLSRVQFDQITILTISIWTDRPEQCRLRSDTAEFGS